MKNKINLTFESQIAYGCNSLKDKKGIIKPDADGYYSIVLGAFNVCNAHGAYYPFGKVKKLFEESSSLMRRIRSGCLKGEMGHPRKEPNMTEREWVSRVYDVVEKNVACHIRKVVLDDNDNSDKGIVTVIGEVKPSGPMGSALKESLENRFEDVCFSIRSFTSDKIINNVLVKNVEEIVTWDVVTEPGIDRARKYSSPSLESILSTPISISTIKELLYEDNFSAVSMESHRHSSLKNLYDNLKKDNSIPSYAKW